MSTAEYLGMPLTISELDRENLAYFAHCADHRYHLQHCESCGLVRYPPTTACPWCMAEAATWVPVEGRGTVHSYTEVRHAIQPAFRGHVPYLTLLVELDHQRGRPSPGEALRIAGNLVAADGRMAAPDLVASVGISSRLRMVFSDVAVGLSVPNWTLDEDAEQPAAPWRYPE